MSPAGKKLATIRVLVVDDHAIFREGCKLVFDNTEDIRMAGEASTGREALDKVRREPWDVVVLDIALPDRNGIEVMKDIKRIKPDLPVLLLSYHDEKKYGPRTLRAGAAGFVNKEAAPEELVTAIRKVHAGGKYVSPVLAEVLAYQLDESVGGPQHENLSDREYQIMCMIAAGKTPRQIAQELGLSVKTVSTFRARILEKLGLSTNADIIRYALEHQLIE